MQRAWSALESAEQVLTSGSGSSVELQLSKEPELRIFCWIIVRIICKQ